MKKPLGRPGRVCENNTRTEFKEMVQGDVDWTHVAKDRKKGKDAINTVPNSEL
jgi:hypothetical protein